MPQTLRTGGRENADLPAACNPERMINFRAGLSEMFVSSALSRLNFRVRRTSRPSTKVTADGLEVRRTNTMQPQLERLIEH